MNSPLVSATELVARLRDGNMLVVDCRFDLADTSKGEREYLQAHLPGAAYAHLDRDLSDLHKQSLGRHPLPEAEAFSAVLARWGWMPEIQVVAYDAASGGIAAARLWWMLRLIGAHDVAVLDGGISAWQRAGFDLQSGETKRPVSTVQVTFAQNEIVYTDELRHLRETGDVVVLDARAAARFRGEVEPIDKIAGHIPGARNRPLADNLHQDGTFKSPAVLREELSALIGPHAAKEVVHSCGSGVSACANLLAFEHAGLHGSRVYAPSWSGWIADPANAVERGS